MPNTGASNDSCVETGNKDLTSGNEVSDTAPSDSGSDSDAMIRTSTLRNPR